MQYLPDTHPARRINLVPRKVCSKCGKVKTLGEFSQEDVIKLNALSNIRLICAACNLAKNDKIAIR